VLRLGPEPGSQNWDSNAQYHEKLSSHQFCSSSGPFIYFSGASSAHIDDLSATRDDLDLETEIKRAMSKIDRQLSVICERDVNQMELKHI
jgi:hypothetical protein